MYYHGMGQQSSHAVTAVLFAIRVVGLRMGGDKEMSISQAMEAIRSCGHCRMGSQSRVRFPCD